MKDITIHPKATIKEAMEALDKTAEKVLLVVDGKQALIGTLTDGDIRRYILKEQDLIGPIENAFNKNPIFVFKEDIDTGKVVKILTKNKINLIPILDHKTSDVLNKEGNNYNWLGFILLCNPRGGAG